jgi:hypothetical protein
VTAVVLGVDSSVRHDLADDGPWILCHLGGELLHTGALDDGPVNCWACRTIRAGDDPTNPTAPARPGGAR